MQTDLILFRVKEEEEEEETMGLLTSQGEPLSWKETQLCAEHVRQHGIKQFINMYIQNKDRQDNCFKWGDEVRICSQYFTNLP